MNVFDLDAIDGDCWTMVGIGSKLEDLLASHLALEQLLPEDDVYVALSGLPSDQRARIAQACAETLRRHGHNLDLSLIASILLGVWPESRRFLHAPLTTSRALFGELLFQFFCAAELCIDELSTTTKQGVRDLAIEHLSMTKDATESSAYAAADFIGGKWPDLHEACNILRRIAFHGRFAVGRDYAIYGLGEVARRTRSLKRRYAIRDTVARIAEEDRSRHVQARARLQLSRLLARK